MIHMHYSFFYFEFEVHVMMENVFDILEEHIASILWVEIMRMDDRCFCILNGVLGPDYVKNSPFKGWRTNESRKRERRIRTSHFKEACIQTELSLNKQVLGHIPNTEHKLFNFLTLSYKSIWLYTVALNHAKHWSRNYEEILLNITRV